jgi:hypothetical protein
MIRILATVLQENLTLLVRPGEDASQSWPGWAVIAAGVVGVTGVAYYLFTHRRRQAARAGTAGSAEPADAIALRELAGWETLADEARFREAVAAISGTVRRYVEARFGLRAPTLTTEEFWARLRADRPVPAQYDPFFEDFMSACDEIKYAGRQPAPPQFAGLVAAAAVFVRAAGRGPR